MAYTTTELVAKFRELSGENSAKPTATEVLAFINLARSGDESPLIELYPQLSSEMGALADPIYVSLVANTARYNFTTTPNKISKAWVKFNADDDYFPVEYLVHQRIDEGSNAARYYGANNHPVIGVYNNGFDVYPEPDTAVTNGVRFDSLVLPAAMASGGSTVESNRIALVIIKRAIHIYYRSMKRIDEAQFWEQEVFTAMSRLLKNLPTGAPEKRIPRGRGSLSRFIKGR